MIELCVLIVPDKQMNFNVNVKAGSRESYYMRYLLICFALGIVDPFF